jgi:hypothetical protein
MAVIDLNRLTITGPIDLDMPKVVIDEIAKAHGTTPKNVLDPSECVTLSVRQPYKKGHLRAIARYVNPACTWNQKALLQSFEFLQEFTDDKCVVPTEVPHFGPQTPENPYSYNACMLYKLHKAWGLKTYHDTTLDDMAFAVRLYLLEIDELQEKVVTVAKGATKEQLIVMMVRQKNIGLYNSNIEISELKVNEIEVSTASLESVMTKFDRESILKRISPCSDSEAVALGIINYGIDLSYSQSAVNEYHHFCQYGIAYAPSDYIMLNRFKYNPRLFDIKYTFNPTLPESLYNNDVLEHLIHLEGISNKELIDNNLTKYEYLQLVSFKDNIYHGLQMNIQSSSTLIYKTDLHDLDPSSIICLGTYNNLEPLTYEELARYWESVVDYLHPATSDVLPRAIIKKILTINSERKKLGLTKTANIELNYLVDVINKIESDKVLKSQQVDNFYTQYQSLSKQTQNKIKACIQKLFLLSMAMRGWHKGEAYPIETAQTRNQLECDVNVTDAYTEFIQSCELLGKDQHIVMDLPLFLYYQNEFKTTSDPEQGILLRDRLKIVTDGRSIHSCIRTSSNWLATSAYRYMVLLRMKVPFDIERLTRIG